MTVVYDAPTQSYTLTAGSRVQRFGPADIDATLGTAAFIVYKRAAGTVTDTLSLVRHVTDSSGQLNYQYVGGGVWQRTISGDPVTSGTVDSFAYGVRTPDAQVPRNGTVRFDVGLIGVSALLSGVNSLGGSGAVNVHFDTGKMDGIGEERETSVAGLPQAGGTWQLTGQLASSNAFFRHLFPEFQWALRALERRVLRSTGE